ncbi:hypothetical protein RRG08_062488, partial [Elysia crispata]
QNAVLSHKVLAKYLLHESHGVLILLRVDLHRSAPRAGRRGSPDCSPSRHKLHGVHRHVQTLLDSSCGYPRSLDHPRL